MNYFQKLKDPRWQQKRLNILARDNFQCQECKSTTETLHVHHKHYEYGKDPWAYEDLYLITLCESCHQCEEYAKACFKDSLHDLLLNGFTYQQLSRLFSTFIHVGKLGDSRQIEISDFVLSLSFLACNKESLERGLSASAELLNFDNG